MLGTLSRAVAALVLLELIVTCHAFMHEMPRDACRVTSFPDPPGPVYDLVIIGAGAAGSMTALRFLETTNCTATVAIIEAGEDVSGETSVLLPLTIGANLKPDGTIFPGFNPKTDWNFRTRVTDDAIFQVNRTAAYPMSHSIGGGTSHNAMVWWRPTEQDFDRWAEVTGNSRFSAANMLARFKALENNTFYGPLDPAHHGNSGPIQVIRGFGQNYNVTEPSVNALFYAAHNVLGMPFTGVGGNLDGNGNQTYREGVGEWQRTVFPNDRASIAHGGRAGTRSYVGNSIMPRVLSMCPMGVVTLYSKTFVTRIVLDGTRAIGVEYLAGTDSSQDYSVDPRFNATTTAAKLAMPRQRIYARFDTALTTGTFNAVQLMELSGIGQANVLQSAGVTLVKDLPGVGENVQDHPEIPQVFMQPLPANLTNYSQPWYLEGLRAPTNPAYCNFTLPCVCNLSAGVNDPCFTQYLQEGTGIYSLNVVPAGFNTFSGEYGRAKTRTGDCHTHFVPGGIFTNWDTPLVVTPLAGTFLTELNKAEARGRVHIRTNNPVDSPLIDMGYGTNLMDMLRLANCSRIVRQVALDPSWQTLFGFGNITEWNRTAGVLSDADFIQYLSREAFGHHAASALMMGRRDNIWAVADAYGRAYGTQNLAMAGQSTNPELGNGNPMTQPYLLGDMLGLDLGARFMALRNCSSADDDWAHRTPVLDATPPPPPPPTDLTPLLIVLLVLLALLFVLVLLQFVCVVTSRRGVQRM